jgi:hypothetical protein
MSEPHDVVKLLIKRMESHPEEFRVGGKPFCDRWDEHISDVQAFGNEADVNTLNAKLRDIRLGEIHERVMDELCNGEERRRKEREEHEYERNLSKSVALTKYQMMQQATQGLQNAYANAYDVDRDMMVGVGTQSPTTKLTVGTASSDVASSILNSMRRMLK